MATTTSWPSRPPSYHLSCLRATPATVRQVSTDVLSILRYTLHATQPRYTSTTQHALITTHPALLLSNMPNRAAHLRAHCLAGQHPGGRHRFTSCSSRTCYLPFPAADAAHNEAHQTTLASVGTIPHPHHLRSAPLHSTEWGRSPQAHSTNRPPSVPPQTPLQQIDLLSVLAISYSYAFPSQV
ncbi:hypothetical protein M3J09_005928 [Ascochyta lentis]